LLNRTSLAAVTHLPLPSRPLTAGGQWRVGGNGDVRLPLISFPLTSATQDGKSHVQDGTTFGFYPLVGLDQLNMSFYFPPSMGPWERRFLLRLLPLQSCENRTLKKNRVVDADLNTYHVYVHVTIQPWFCFVTWQQLHDEFFFLDSDPQLMETTHDTPLM
jgi:hypothetical protein